MSKIKKILYYAKYNKKMLIYKVLQKIIKIKAVRMLVPPIFHIKIDYYIRLGKDVNLNKPATFNEKLQWLKLHDKKPEYVKIVDKYEVRKYIAETIGDNYLIPLLGVYNHFGEIDFNSLPGQFVLKCTHDSGGIVFCKDKSKFNVDASRIKINNCLKRNYYYHGMEWPYKSIKPRIICEKYMVDESGTELKDYKFLCFNGKVKCISVCWNRYSGSGLNIDFYNIYWEPMLADITNHLNSGYKVPKPKNFDRMVEIAEKLSGNMIFVRVDFYEAYGQLFFGELTLYPGSGFEKFVPESFDYLMGSWIQLPIKKLSNQEENQKCK